MPLGDSITDGYIVPGGYRIQLWTLAQSQGLGIDFVGSESSGPAELGDLDHEGHPAWKIESLEANVDGWLRQYHPDVVLLGIGTNDMWDDTTARGAPAALARLVDQITRDLPEAVVIVASIPPIDEPVDEQRVQAFNSAIPTLVAERAAAGQHVRFLDMHAQLTVADLADGVHPNRAGYDKMGAAWFDAVKGLLCPARGESQSGD